MSTRGISTDSAPNWRDQADCRKPGMDPELWFPKGTTGVHALLADEAKAFCHDCPVAMTCALWALERRLSDGIYGGLTEAQRHRILRKGSDVNLVAEVRAAWTRDTRNRLVDAYLGKTIQGEGGHVWWRGTKTSVTVAGRTITPAQLAFEIGHGRPPEGHVRAGCGMTSCVAAEHLTDSRIRWARPRPAAA